MMWVIYKEELTRDRNVAISEKDADTLLWNSYFIICAANYYYSNPCGNRMWVKISSDLSLPR